MRSQVQKYRIVKRQCDVLNDDLEDRVVESSNRHDDGLNVGLDK
jgi:hypothetical protein